MVEKLESFLFSSRFMAILFVLYAAAMGIGTFIENDFTTETAKVVVYNAWWFELIMVLLAINFIGNIVKYRLNTQKKLSVLIFHIAFLLILIGGAVTRYISFEGVMHIREGETSNTIISEKTYFQMRIDNNQVQRAYNKVVYFSDILDNSFNDEFEFLNDDVQVKYVDYIPVAVETVKEVPNGKYIIHLVSSGTGKRQDNFLQEKSQKLIDNLPVVFDIAVEGAFQIIKKQGKLYFKSPYDVRYTRMADQKQGKLHKNTLHPLQLRTLYTVLNQVVDGHDHPQGGVNLVVKQVYENAEITHKSAEDRKSRLQDVLIVDVTYKARTERVHLKGGKGTIPNLKPLGFKDLNIYMGYGSKKIETPFALKLNNFQLDRYPGTNTASSYASDLVLIDGQEKTNYRVYMNNVLDYQGYRFFQSSYDQDEKGTILSVNHDSIGTTVTYVGYFLLIVGMALTLFSKHSRFAKLNKSIRQMKSQKIMMMLLFFVLLSFKSMAQQFVFHKYKDIDSLKQAVKINREHAAKFGNLVIQDYKGRLKPINTMASEVLRKIYHKDKFERMNPDQTFVSMIYNPIAWQFIPFIYVNRKSGLREKFGIKKYLRFINAFNNKGEYIIKEDVERAHQKKPFDRNEYDKEIIALDERINIAYNIFSGSILKIFPIPNHENNKWASVAEDGEVFSGKDSLFVNKILLWYKTNIAEAKQTGDWSKADKKIEFISKFQNNFGKQVMPHKSKIKLEIEYNKHRIFSRLFHYYVMFGVLLLIFSFIRIFKSKSKLFKYISYILDGCIFVLFLIHTIGLGLRWYISGHAPWSNGYESMIYISWTTILAGFVFVRKSQISLAATAILASLILWVADLNWLDPEITNLVPVLKSYWLSIHVSVIVASYGFLSLGALLGFLVLCMMIFFTKSNAKRLKNTIKELSYINEMTLTIGIFMLTVGTFLGGVWANESWGRYWSWDPKETWAFASVFVYAFILHMHLVPSLRGFYKFNLASVIGLASILMTYFGVNYYLGGLHSYAKGDPMPLPAFIYYIIITVGGIGVLAYFKQRKYL